MKIFISSTCYDLIDLRAALAAELRDMGATPLLSDERTSEFEVSGAPDENSIQTCLNNVQTSDAVIFVLSQRYGPPLPKPFASVSATHLEYLEAEKHKKRRYVYVRDRLSGDYDLWRAQGAPADFKGAWIKSPKDHGLFRLIEDHRQLVRNNEADRMNWFIPFTDVRDLTQDVRRRFAAETAWAAAEKLIETGQVPIVVLADQSVQPEHSQSKVMTNSWVRFEFLLQNVGPVPAIAVTGTLEIPGVLSASTPESSVAAISPVHSANNQGTRIQVDVSRENVDLLIAEAAKAGDRFTAHLQIGYTTPLGHQLADDWVLSFKIRGKTIEYAERPQYLRKRVCGYRNFITRESVTVSAS